MLFASKVLFVCDIRKRWRVGGRNEKIEERGKREELRGEE